MTTSLVLASTSQHRRLLLARLHVPFATVRPTCDEASQHDLGLVPEDLAATLARIKAHSVADAHRDAIVIGSDQVCALGSEVLGKPGTRPGALAQLARLSGLTHELLTAVCVVHQGQEHAFVDVSRLTMRVLTDAEIARYVDLDAPFDCAGSYKLEGAGIALFTAIASQDHTAIVGLPLLRLCRVLRACGLPVP